MCVREGGGVGKSPEWLSWPAEEKLGVVPSSGEEAIEVDGGL
jgi:hypothetical protein